MTFFCRQDCRLSGLNKIGKAIVCRMEFVGKPFDIIANYSISGEWEFWSKRSSLYLDRMSY